MGCCSGYNFAPAPDAVLDPSQRVNFNFGMVLGVDDFLQEHAYLAGRDERALRELVGYGVITGLDVRTTVASPRVEVRVGPGLALLPDGKLVGVAADQCARLDEWLADPAAGKPDAGKSGPASVYVVLRHVEVSGTPVPIPGEPCRDESALVADSRIADSFQLGFSWTPPEQPEDDALRSFAAWLRRVQVRPAAVTPTPLDLFLAAVKDQVTEAIANARAAFDAPPLAETPAPDPDPADGDSPPSAPLVIPREHYAEYINAAFDVWVRELRAGQMAHFGPVPPAQHEAEAGLLLAAIDIHLENGTLQFPSPPDSAAAVRWLGRAQLVHLRLLQEWLIVAGEQDVPLDAAYLLGRGDTRLPGAQDLHADFAGDNHALARVDLVTAAGGEKAVLRPALKWPGPAPGADGDYYGPRMKLPIPVRDGGTGQNDPPKQGQLLVGVTSTPRIPATFELGRLLAAEHRRPDGSTSPNLKVSLGSAPDIVVDTVQDIGPDDSPHFAGLAVSGAANVGQLSLDAPLAIRSGGTGLATLPMARQLLIGAENNIGTYVRAALADSETVKVNVTQADTDEWQIQLEAASGPGITVPVAVVQGGTGQTAAPQPGQLLTGGADGNFTVGSLRPASVGRHIAVAQAGADLAIDTTPQAHWATRIVQRPIDKLRDDDHVVLLNIENDATRFALGDPQDERVVVIKLCSKGVAELMRNPDTQDEVAFIDNSPTLRLAALQAVTLIGSKKLNRWFVIGRG